MPRLCLNLQIEIIVKTNTGRNEKVSDVIFFCAKKKPFQLFLQSFGKYSSEGEFRNLDFFSCAIDEINFGSVTSESEHRFILNCFYSILKIIAA